MIELKCPFCGGEAKLLKVFDRFYVKCCNRDCPLIFTTWIADNETEAVNAWNYRVDEEE